MALIKSTSTKKTIKETTEPKVTEAREEIVTESQEEAANPITVQESVDTEEVSENEVAKVESGSKAVQEVAPKNVMTASDRFSENAAEQGFEGLDLSQGMFPTLVIGTTGTFDLDGEPEEFDEIVGRLENSYVSYIHQQKGVQDGDAAFSMDNVNLLNSVDDCTTVAELAAKWEEEEGIQLETKSYLNVLCEVIDGPENLVESFLVCKLPTMSKDRFKAIPFMASRRNVSFKDIHVKFAKGKPKKSSSNKAYTPWAFTDVTKQYN